jgi:hypothetical protein
MFKFLLENQESVVYCHSHQNKLQNTWENMHTFVIFFPYMKTADLLVVNIEMYDSV